MRLVKWIGFAAIIIFLLVFILENIGTQSLRSDLSLRIFGCQTPEWPVLLWLALSFFCGIFLFMLVSAVREIKLRSQMFSLRNEIDSLREELGFEEEEDREDE